MSELQIDDPDPLPIDREPIRNSTEFERLRIDDREMITRLSNYASGILESDTATGHPTERHIAVKKGELSRRIEEGLWAFSFIDTLEGRRRCRSWELGGKNVNWCRDERRHEPAEDVLKRLEEVFLPQDSQDKEVINPEQSTSRLKRILAALALHKVKRPSPLRDDILHIDESGVSTRNYALGRECSTHRSGRGGEDVYIKPVYPHS